MTAFAGVRSPSRGRAAAFVVVSARERELRHANCAGVGCPEREDCKRYRLRVMESAAVRADRTVAPWSWVSADHEREWFGTCALKIEYVEPEQRRKAA